jgi:hypothetical protein
MDASKYTKRGTGSEAKDCFSNWCCPGRLSWMTPILAAIVVSFSIFAFAASLIAFTSTRFASSQNVYTTSGTIQPTSMNQVLLSTGPLAMTLPNNMIEFIGASYNFACLTPGHTITILGGALPTTFDGVNRRATCTLAGAGFSIQVMNSLSMRTFAVSSPGITFSNP